MRRGLAVSIGVAVAALASSSAIAKDDRPAAPACPILQSPAERPWLDTTLTPACRAKLVLASFGSTDEKLDAVMTRGSAWLAARGLPVLAGGDGPAGIRGRDGVTAFPTPLTIAASFDPVVAARYGDLLGREFFAYGYNRIGGPALDIARTWHFGRVTESLGEDPFLAARIAAAETRAIGARHVMPMIKHFAVYTQEQGRAGDHPLRTRPAVDHILSERVLREIYLPAFEAAVTEGGAASVMCSFPRINGVYACENPLTLSILKNEWGFDGTVVPDFPDAQRSIVNAVNAGLDTGLFGTGAGKPVDEARDPLATQTDDSFGGENLRVAVRAGKVGVARIDDMILRRLTPAFRLGAFDHPARRVAADVSTPQTRADAAEIVADGAVLLKNDDGILPFGRGIRSIAVIGAQAGLRAQATEMGSAYVAPAHLVSAVAAIRDRAGPAVRVAYAPGTLGLDRLPVAPTALFRTPTGEAGFRAEYFANPALDFTGKALASRIEPAIENTAIPTIDGLPANRAWSVRWTGIAQPTETGVHKFTLAGSGTGRLYIGDRLIGRFENADFGDTVYANVPMTAGDRVAVRVEWTPRVTFRQSAIDSFGTTLGPALRLGWSGPDDLIARAVALARTADVAVVLVGQRIGEGMDRQSLSLSNDQDALISAVAAANPRTLVVLQTGGAVLMPWLSSVKAVLETWLPGDALGPATAALLFGDRGPGGRLPITFPADETQGPGVAQRSYPGTLSATGAIDTAHFDEGLLIGYRFWETAGQQPLFPFGYGLNYTRFTLGQPQARMGDGQVELSIPVANIGDRTGSEVVQAYVRLPRKANAPFRQLRGFVKVELAPREARTAKMSLDHRALRYWNATSKTWSVAAGVYEIAIGRHSRDVMTPIRFKMSSAQARAIAPAQRRP